MKKKGPPDPHADDTLRKVVIDEGRGMVRVRFKESRDCITAAVCPGCWNDPKRREKLISRMNLMGVEPVHKDDLVNGVYRKGKKHSPKCRHNPDRHWKRFSEEIRKFKSG